jgi:hypothetical protein
MLCSLPASGHDNCHTEHLDGERPTASGAPSVQSGHDRSSVSETLGLRWLASAELAQLHWHPHVKNHGKER